MPRNIVASIGALLTRAEAAKHLNVSVRWLEDCPDIPVVNLAPATSRRRMVRYRLVDLDGWISEHLVGATVGGRG